MDALIIEQLGSPVLRQRAVEVEAVTEDVRELVRRMFITMYSADGQGLAAPQVGVARRIAVVDVPPRRGPTHVLINPRVVAVGAKLTSGVEGCLSIPHVWGTVERPTQVIVEALDLEGKSRRLEANGDLARCFQHEIDHLDGMLYMDRMSPLARNMLLGRYRKAVTQRQRVENA
jgi:peptide deformylase